MEYALDTAYKWKVVVVGEPTAGKTSLMIKYTEKKFSELYIPTVGVQVSVKDVILKPGKYELLAELNIWDIAGHSKFQSVRKIFYEGANAFLLLYDCTSQGSFDGTSYWAKDLRDVIGDQYGVLVANKIDLEQERVISTEKGKELAKNLNLAYLETSAKTGENVTKLFDLVSQKLLEMYGE